MDRMKETVVRFSFEEPRHVGKIAGQNIVIDAIGKLRSYARSLIASIKVPRSFHKFKISRVGSVMAPTGPFFSCRSRAFFQSVTRLYFDGAVWASSAFWWAHGSQTGKPSAAQPIRIMWLSPSSCLTRPKGMPW